jgi:hypothetical protein
MALAVVRNEFYDLRNKFQTMLQVNTMSLHGFTYMFLLGGNYHSENGSYV